MADLNCYIATFNCGRTQVDVDHFAASFFDGIKTKLPPDLVVLALEEIAPIAYCFLGQSWLLTYITKFIDAVGKAAELKFGGDVKYEGVGAKALGMTGILVLARPEINELIYTTNFAGVGVGNMDLGNKGSAAVRLGLRPGNGDGELVLTFVAAHLAPMEWNCERRNADWKALCEGTVFEQDDDSDQPSDETGEADPLLGSGSASKVGKVEGIFSANSYLFVAGDLNYRTSDKAPGPKDHENWPQPRDDVSDVHHYSHLLERDQLKREHSNNRTLHDLTEAEITFPPTYKYSTEAQQQAGKVPTTPVVSAKAQSWLWAKHRIPSWCDRILYLAAAPPTVHSYTALPVQPTSDHRPVVLSCSIPRKPLDLDIKPPFPLRKDWKQARVMAERWEFLIGIAAYLGLTYEGQAILFGIFGGLIGGYLGIRALLVE